jgi:hypothetical protein
MEMSEQRVEEAGATEFFNVERSVRDLSFLLPRKPAALRTVKGGHVGARSVHVKTVQQVRSVRRRSVCSAQ